jgi:hypothetical protein
MPATRTSPKTRNARQDVQAVAKRPIQQSPEQPEGPLNASSEVAKLEDDYILVAASKAGRVYKYEYGADIQVSVLMSPLASI